MRISVKEGRIEREPAEAIILSCFEDDEELQGKVKLINRKVSNKIEKITKDGEFKGKINQVSLLHTIGEIPAKRILLAGLGKKKDFNIDRVRQAIGRASTYLRRIGIKRITTPLHGDGLSSISLSDSAQAIVEGSILGLYQFNKYKTENLDEIKEVEELVIVEDHDLAEIKKGAKRGEIIADATNFARDLINHPSNYATPTRMADAARDISKEHNLKCKVLERPDMERLGMGGLLGVSKGSQEPPKFIIVEYQGAKKKTNLIVLVGKTITFDSGGISIKPSEKMEQMKDDMSGGASVLGCLLAASRLKIPLNIVGLLPASENMPSGSAIKPGDILKTMSGKTIEVISTDAEGRMILADALTYATRYKPAAIIDLATLTGACIIALGNFAIGLMGNNNELISKIKRAGDLSGERVWELPLWEEYKEQIRSDIADLKNVGGRAAGTITAGAFLGKFVGDYPWAHLDIAGTSWNEQDRPYMPKGGTGVGVRLLIQFLSEYNQ